MDLAMVAKCSVRDWAVQFREELTKKVSRCLIHLCLAGTSTVLHKYLIESKFQIVC